MAATCIRPAPIRSFINAFFFLPSPSVRQAACPAYGGGVQPEEKEQEPVIVTCRGGLEAVVAEELRDLGIEVTEIGRRVVFGVTDLAGLYRANMALRCALGVLRPLRSFNARNYDMLYYQARKTNWHKLFPVEANIRIDVKGGSDVLDHTQFVTHRVKDGIVDTFRKLCGGRRPSVDKRDPDVHIVVYLDQTRVTLCIDSSGSPLFKRGYRIRHGEAPLKEDLAAGLLALSGWDRSSSLLDPMCGAGTLLFEAWMMAARVAPNLHRRFGFEALLDYRHDLHDAEAEKLAAREKPPGGGFFIEGLEIDHPTFRTLEDIRRTHFPEAPIHLHRSDFRSFVPEHAPAMVVCNPPYGVRIGEAEEIGPLYRDLGRFLSEQEPAAKAAIYTANHEAAPGFGGDKRRSIALRNGALEGRLYLIAPQVPD